MAIKTMLCNPHNYGGYRNLSKITFLVVHFTSNFGDTAQNNAEYFSRETLKRKASAHYFVDENEIWSSVPEDFVAYHVGATKYKHPTCRNANSIGVEICMNAKDNSIRMASIDRAVLLVRGLMEKYNIPISRVLRHYDVTGKDCPAPMVHTPELWKYFQIECTKEEDEVMKTYNFVKDMPEWAQKSAKKAIKKGVIAMDKEGAVSVQECNLQPLVWMDRAGLLD